MSEIEQEPKKRQRGRPEGRSYSQQRSFWFAVEDIELLAELAREKGTSQAAVLRELIREAAKKRRE